MLLLFLQSKSISSSDIIEQCEEIAQIERLDCHPDQHASFTECKSRGCCWIPKTILDDDELPMCFFPKSYPTYNVVSSKKTVRGFIAQLYKSNPKYYRNEIKNISFEFRQETSTRLRLRFSIPSQPNRWEPPIPLGQPDDILDENVQYNVSMENSPFGLKITRNNKEQDVILDSLGSLASSLIFSNQFIQITFRVNAQKGFGPGELEKVFPNPLNKWMRLGFWAHDGIPQQHSNLYGTHNFFMGLKHDGTAFGVFFLNSNAQEVAITPLPAITYRTIGGILDFFVFTGPKPLDVLNQYYTLIGHPAIPPYWSLGFHVCRYGMRNVEEAKTMLKRNVEAGIPIDAQWFDIDYMDAYKIWSVDKKRFDGIGTYVNDILHKQYSMRTVIIVDPAVSTKGGSGYLPYEDGMRLGVFINDSRTGTPIIGTVWPGETVFPDFSHPSTEDWWYKSASDFYEVVNFDGLWIDMNEPANFNDGSLTGCPSWNKLDNPPYIPKILQNSLYDKTICPSALHYNTTHYNLHNMYGYHEARVTHNVLKRLFPDRRPFILTRSSYAGSGMYAAHWTGDVLSNWDSLKASVAQIINFNMFGIPMVGADICGFVGNTTQELCVRWSQLGAFYPFSRNHNEHGSKNQDPAHWSKETAEAIRQALRLKYHLLPYIYTLFYRAYLNGTTVARALAFEFPEDLSTHKINAQFMLGSCILVTPVLDEGRVGVEGYVPSGEWINLSTGKRYFSRGTWMYFDAPLNIIPISTRCGCIIPIQIAAETTDIARKKGFGLFVILSSSDDGSDASGERITASVRNRKLSVISTPSSVDTFQKIDMKELDLKMIFIVGISIIPKEILLNNNPVKFTYHHKEQTCHIDSEYYMTLSRNFIIQWHF
ncbi:Lysosomal alpha-glucosidase [Schistosoma japonicum]|uniref:Lysosomal alpha-glucosidase n=2 Tax=Schistosoma japonicum TaxID=6182 RepID=A0A4Z2D8S7_SCHJA|nr:Lysosomal alpha-glucosidase [Schistosoma japonicum]